MAAMLGVVALLTLGSACRTVPDPGNGQAAAPLSDPAHRAALQAVSGDWYIMARTPNVLERGHMDSQVRYDLHADGRLAVTYRYRLGPNAPLKERTVQAAATGDNTAHPQWRLRLLRMLPLTQRVLERAPDGSWLLLESPERGLAWVLMRSPALDDADYLQLRRKLDEHGVNIDKVWRVVQDPAQLGARGFDQPRRH